MIERGTPVLINFRTVAQVTALLLILASLFTSPDFKVDACRHVAPSAAVSDGSVTQLRSLWDVPDGVEPNRTEPWKLAVNARFRSHLQVYQT
ncbi:hypothetical protein FocTR4_00003480 [Fusarium oxysporum f. sp. cubense]|uniref:Uncharacterized protein n=1 Tax=Fusarium oxysporum f. sp. cubense TaxID=61366 RepID=A0A5C6T9X3_FUSOC|nr:hypothetical protein FocTR4_00003480 [Fusarium oxysporum f. sp. cubense]